MPTIAVERDQLIQSIGKDFSKRVWSISPAVFDRCKPHLDRGMEMLHE